MKSFLMRVTVLFLFLGGEARACEFCGCSVSDYNPFLFPHLSKSYFGLSYNHRHYRTRNDLGQWNDAYYRSALLSAQFSVSGKVQIAAGLPYSFNQLQADGATKSIAGIGDATITMNYRLWEHSGTKISQSISIGGGLKLPTGRYEPVHSGEAQDQNFQLGTGSVDYLLQGVYRLSVSRFVFAVNATYKYNTPNTEGFRFGDVYTGGLTVIFRKEFKDFSILPYAMVMTEQYLKDARNHVLQAHSGGSVLYTGAGFDINTRKLAIGLNYQFAPSQNLGERSIEVAPRFSAHLSFVL